MKEQIYFSDKGITATSANHLTNVAKEYLKEKNEFLDSLSFFGESLSLITSSEKKITKIGSTLDQLNTIESIIEEIGKINSLVAWLKEAIKEKNNLTEQLENKRFETYVKEIGKELKSFSYPTMLSFGDVLKTLSIKELSEYHTLGSMCAHIGKQIHDGNLAKQRSRLHNIVMSPVASYGSGSETTIKEFTPSVETKEIDSVYFNLQNKHRQYSARLNSIKYSLEQKASKLNDEIRSSYEKELLENSKVEKLLYIDFENYKKSEFKKIQDLKIIIPDELIEVYEFLNNIGK